MQMIVGSTALQYHGLARSTPKDDDIWTTDSLFVNTPGIDGHNIPMHIHK